MTESDDTEINFDRRIASSLTEIGRHIAEATDTDVMNHRRLAKRFLVQAYTRQHNDVFTQNGRLDWVYAGDSPKGYLPPSHYEQEEETPDEEKVRFPNEDAPEVDL